MPGNILAGMRVFTGYAQIWLCDVESPSTPQWETGEEFVFDEYGVAVATADHTDVWVTVFDGTLGRREADAWQEPGATPWRLCCTGVIEVGRRGLQVGDETSSEYANIWWHPGKTQVTIYGNGTGHDITRLHIVLNPLD